MAPTVAAALVLLPGVWGLSRHLVTLVHEIGHAAVAVATGRRLAAIRLHADTSGLTVSAGRARGPGMVATAAAGYLAPSVCGLALTVVVRSDQVDAALWAVLGLMVVVALFVRNLFGAVVVLAVGVATWFLVTEASLEVRESVALVVAWFLLLGGPRTVVELWGTRRRGRGTTDADVLARLTHVPAALWNLLLLLAGLAALWPAVTALGT